MEYNDPEGVSSFGITGTEIPLSKNSIFSHLENNEPIICSMRQETLQQQDILLYLPKQKTDR